MRGLAARKTQSVYALGALRADHDRYVAQARRTWLSTLGDRGLSLTEASRAPALSAYASGVRGALSADRGGGRTTSRLTSKPRLRSARVAR